MKKIVLMTLMLGMIIKFEAAIDYNGTPINRSGRITITPQTSPGILASYTQAFNMDGLLDQTFGQRGIVKTPGTGAGAANAAILQPDGKIIAVGGNGTTFELIRYNSNGSIDTSFNGGNSVVGANSTNNAYAGLLQSDGKIVAVGVSSLGTGRRFCLVRYNSDGSIDTSFNAGNPVIGANLTNYAYAALLQPDGKIVAVGVSTGSVFCLARYNSDGSVDTTFNGGSPVIGENTTRTGLAALLQPDGKIVAVGTSSVGTGRHFCISRYNSNGSVDTTFGPANTNIIITTDTTARALAALLQPDSKIVAVGTSAVGYDFVLTRYVNPFTLASFTESYGNVGMM